MTNARAVAHFFAHGIVADALCGRVDNVAAFARVTGHEEWMEYREPEPWRSRCRACQWVLDRQAELPLATT